MSSPDDWWSLPVDPMPPPNEWPPPKSVSARDVDKNSRIADTTPNIKFMKPQEHDFPIIVFRCTNAVGTIMLAKKWLLDNYDVGLYGGPEILRMESQELEKLDHKQEGTLLLLECAAWVESKDGKDPVSIMALLMPKDPRVRYWYSRASFKGLLTTLDEREFIALQRTLDPRGGGTHRVTGKLGENRPDAHCRIFVWLRETFLKTLKVPEYPDFLHAISITDFAPSIPHPSTALRRMEACESLYNVKEPPRDLADDRYLLSIHAAERELASLVQLSCAEYLLVKRNFFKDWYVDVYRSDRDVKGGEVVRTNYAHEQYLEKVYEWTVRRSRRLIAGWKALGLLEQEKLVPWAAVGGMLEGSVREMIEREEGDEIQGQGAGKSVVAPRRA